MSVHTIIGLRINERTQNVPAVQAAFTKYGCLIKTRVGLHDVQDNYCSTHGVVVIETVGQPAEVEEFYGALGALPGVQVQRMDFED